MAKTQIFISGIYRSGTTLVSRILNSHSKLWVTYDSVHFMRFSYNRYNPIERMENAEELIYEIHGRIQKRWEMDFDVRKVMGALHRLKKINYRYIYELIMDELASQHKKNIIGWGEKTNVCWGQIPNFLKMFPKGKAIHLVRDPRDVMCSYKLKTYEPGYAYLDSAFASLNSFNSAKNYSKQLSERNYYCLKYEDVVNEPEKTIKSLCDFLEIMFEENMMDVMGFEDKSGKKWDGDSAFNKKFKTISKKPINRWKKQATPLETYFVEMINRPVMQEFNYRLSGIELEKEEWDNLYGILQSPVINARYKNWLKTGEGAEAYPSDPLLK